MGLLDVSARTRLNIALPKTKKIIVNDQLNKKIGLITKALGKCGGPEAFYSSLKFAEISIVFFKE